MEMEEVSSSSANAAEIPSVPVQRGRSKAMYQFTQQNLPACKPVLTPTWVITTMVVTICFAVGTIFIPIGLFSLQVSQSALEIVDRYDVECVPPSFRSNKLEYIKDSSIPKNCSRYLQVNKHMKAPIYIYYQLDNYYQNHRRYVKSRSDKQLLYGLKYDYTGSCSPEDANNDALKVNRKNIAWESDRNHNFGKHVYPFNFQNGSLIGGAHLDPAIPLSDQEDLIVWMRTAALPSFRKLYGRIEEDLHADEILEVKILNNYNTYSFGGRKKLVLSTSSWLGGHNNFIGIAYISIGSSFIFIALVFMLLHVKNPRPYGDTTNISWTWKGISS
ncbi:putative ALA-interacting subunit 2 isoform X3 [Olea europaea var. sylvestris]|uniref:putative ALA-interacting subunit 2 isoform X3 n=1 Tax=Olea europaea var. sylvestris TaxID=158386 RepID=UPI000C1D0A09|nr:putative ALA-interacting subunit 2 isoform X3 [Olea europaea var. sylvestris]